MEYIWQCDDIKPEDMTTKEVEKYTSEFRECQSKKNSFVRVAYTGFKMKCVSN